MASGKGKKGAVNEPQKTDPFLAQNLDYQAPGRAVGLTVMLSLVAFTAAFMSYQSLQLDEATSPASETSESSALSEAKEHFALPGDPLWGFVSIPAGEFIMGSNPQRDRMAYENERWSSTQRQGRVDLPEYFIGRFEVTNAQFAYYLSAIESSSAEAFAELDPALPVTSVSLPQTLSYARWLDSQLRSSAATPVALREALDAGAKVTLPSEAEWEKAARGTDGRIFPWGMEPNGTFANIASAALLPVGSLSCESCSYGIADMAGNAWELTRSPLVDYPFVMPSAEALLRADSLWVMRGGSFQDAIKNVRSAVRGAVDPSVRNPTIGFRLVISRL